MGSLSQLVSFLSKPALSPNKASQLTSSPISNCIPEPRPKGSLSNMILRRSCSLMSVKLEVAAEVPELELEGVKSGEGSTGQSKSEYCSPSSRPLRLSRTDLIKLSSASSLFHMLGDVEACFRSSSCTTGFSVGGIATPAFSIIVSSMVFFLGDAETGSSSCAGLFCPCGVRAAVGGVPGLINAEGVPALMALAGVCPSTLSASFLIVSSSFSKPVTWNSQYSSAHLNFFSGPRGGSTLGCICFLLSSGLCILMLGLGMLPGVVPAFAGSCSLSGVRKGGGTADVGAGGGFDRSPLLDAVLAIAAVAASGAWEGFAWSAFCACSGEEVDFNLSLSRQIWRTILSLTKVMASPAEEDPSGR
ncbi:hypothetical protein KCU93_g480, partial [Aureobasidium melanogenum]